MFLPGVLQRDSISVRFWTDENKGLNTDGWEYQHPLRIIRQDQTELRFFQGFCHKKYGYIACEHLTIDLSSRIRIQKFFQSGTDAKTPRGTDHRQLQEKNGLFYSLTGLLSGDDPELAVKFVTFKNNGKLAAVSQRDAKSRSVILSFKLTYYLQTGKQKRRIQYPLKR